MKKLREIRHALAGAIGTIALYLIFYYQNTLQHQVSSFSLTIAITIIICASYLIPRWVSFWLIRRKWFRKFTWGKSLIEGYWHLKGHASGSNNRLNRDGVAKITFNPDELSFEITVTRLENGETSYDTHSRSFVLLNTNKDVINLFSCIVGDKEIEGVSYGQFTYSAVSKVIDQYNGKIILIEDREVIPQSGTRIRQSEYESYLDNYGTSWIKIYLEQKRNR